MAGVARRRHEAAGDAHSLALQTTMKEYVESFERLKALTDLQPFSWSTLLCQPLTPRWFFLQAEAAESGSDVPYLRSWEIGQDRPDLLADVASGYEYFTGGAPAT